MYSVDIGYGENMKISLVVPCFNEEDTIQLFYDSVRNYTLLSEYEIEIVFVNDGSSDGTESILDLLSVKDELVKVIHFSRNFGKEPALFAGLDHASGDVVIPIDVDLQHPLEVIPLMLEKYKEGYDVVLAKCQEKDAYNFFKRKTSQWFYKVHNKMSSLKIEENVGDFRLMSKDVVQAIRQLPERQLFMKGIYAWAGFKQTVIEYTIADRSAGQSKFNGWKLWNLALEGITSFSTVPLRIWTYIGASVAFLSFLYICYLIFAKLVFGNAVSGWSTIMISILFMGGGAIDWYRSTRRIRRESLFGI